MNAKVKKVFDLSDIYIKERTIERENYCSSPSRVLSRWICIASWNVGDMRPQELNEEHIS